MVPRIGDHYRTVHLTAFAYCHMIQNLLGYYGVIGGDSLCRRLCAGVSDLLTNGECKVGIEGQLFAAILELSHYLDHNGTAETVIDCLGFHQSVILTEGYTRIPKEDKKAALAAMKPYAWTLRYAGTRKGRLVSLACRLLGVRFAAFLMKQYRRAVEK